jgi:hypothetical protein
MNLFLQNSLKNKASLKSQTILVNLKENKKIPQIKRKSKSLMKVFLKEHKS